MFIQKDGSITAVSGVNHSWRRLADSGGGQAAIIKLMIAAHGIALHRSSKHDTASQLFVAS